MSSLEGHRRGYDRLKQIVKAAVNRGVKYVSAYIFSTENWQRSSTEVKYLMDLAYKMLKKDVVELHKENIRIVCLGRRDNLSPKLVRAIEDAELETKDNNRGTLALCFNYGGREELVDAFKDLAASGINPDEINAEKIEQALYHPEVPAADLIVRTSGEKRLSGFMLYRAAYSELYFTDKNWPDFTENDLDDALAEYSSRCRRFGK